MKINENTEYLETMNQRNKETINLSEWENESWKRGNEKTRIKGNEETTDQEPITRGSKGTKNPRTRKWRNEEPR